MIETNTNKLNIEISSVKPQEFEALAIRVFQYQASYNYLYEQYIQLLGINPVDIKTISEIPFLPISLFKSHKIQTGNWQPVKEFTSSGTTGENTSRHLVQDERFYLTNAKRGFEHFYGAISQYQVFALLPSYLERQGSSLIAMMQYFINIAQPGSGFYLNEFEAIVRMMLQAKDNRKPVLLMGVSFALLDLAEQYDIDLDGIIMMETGGMKGRRKEMIREELHDILKQKFKLASIHSEYGMTELFSQAYSKGNGLFYPAPTMKVMSRPVNDPLGTEKTGKTGILNIIDLANINTCSFIATDDLGVVYEDGSFTVSGRADNSDIRGCNLLLG